MTYAWSRWLPEALASDAFVAKRLIIEPGWDTRGRPPELFSYLPSGVLDHHTACMIKPGHDPATCLRSVRDGHGVTPGPISQLLGTFTAPGVRWDGTNVDPHIIVVAAGRSNHAGTGEWPWGAPGGNGSAIGIEWCGPPEGGWPDEVIELRARVVAAILRWNGWPIDRSTTHWEYARPQGRKIDPSARWLLQPDLDLLEPWSPDAWRGHVATYIDPPLPPEPPEEDDMMRIYLAYTVDSAGTKRLYRGNGLDSHLVDDATRKGMEGRSFSDPRMCNYFDPVTEERLTSWKQVPTLSANQIILDLGRPR